MSCTICQHPQRQEIDQALIAGSATLAALGQQYNLSTSALHRHKAHLQAKVGRAQGQLQDNLRQGCLFWLTQALEMTMQTAQTAQAEGNGRLVLRALAQGTRLVTILLKQEFPLDDRMVFELLTSPQWATQTGLLPQDPGIMSMSRAYLVGALSSPCSDDPPPSPSSFSQEDLDLLQQLLPGLTSPEISGAGVLPVNSCPDRKSQDQKPAAGNRQFQKWEKSGKLPGKTSLDKMISKENHGDKLKEKNTGKDPQSCCAGSWLDELAAGRLDLETLTAIGSGRHLSGPSGISKDTISPRIAGQTEKVV